MARVRIDAMTMSTTSPERAAGPTAYYRFRPLNIGRYLIWSLFAIALIVVPMLFRFKCFCITFSAQWRLC